KMRHRVKHRPSYADVEIDPRWATFDGFLANQPAGRPYEPGLCLCRFNDEGDYTPENCRWDDRGNNTREAWANGRVAAGIARRSQADDVIAVLTKALSK